jgi:hypothetical protein
VFGSVQKKLPAVEKITVLNSAEERENRFFFFCSATALRSSWFLNDVIALSCRLALHPYAHAASIFLGGATSASLTSRACSPAVKDDSLR